MGIGAFQTKMSFDNRKIPSNLDFLFKIGSYAVSEKPLVQSDDVDITMLKATGSLEHGGREPQRTEDFVLKPPESILKCCL